MKLWHWLKRLCGVYKPRTFDEYVALKFRWKRKPAKFVLNLGELRKLKISVPPLMACDGAGMGMLRKHNEKIDVFGVASVNPLAGFKVQ
jgi:hypothetical protein